MAVAMMVFRGGYSLKYEDGQDVRIGVHRVDDVFEAWTMAVGKGRVKLGDSWVSAGKITDLG